MRTLAAFLLLICGAASAGAQTVASADQSGVQVVKFGWSKERIGWEHNPFNGPNENFHEMQMRARSEKRVSDAKRGGNSSEVSRAERDARADAAIAESHRRQGPPRYGFTYKVTVRNAAAKAVREIDWDYVFYDEATREEISRRQFASVVKVSPGKSKELSFFISSPPAQKISAHSLDKRERDGMKEQVVVVRVVYEDGTVWQTAAPPAP